MNIRSYMGLLISVGCLAAVLLSGCSAAEAPPVEPTAPAVTEPVSTEPPYTMENIGGVDCYSIDGRVYAAELGAPILGKDAVAELYNKGDLAAAAEKITNVGDALYYLRQGQTPRDPRAACRLVATLIAGDYDAMGFIEMDYTNNAYKVLYIEHNGKYYGVDPFDRWLSGEKNACIRDVDLEVLAENLEAALPHKGTELVSLSVSGDMSKNYGVPVFSYLGTTIPEGLRKPVLTDEEIDALIAEQDYAKTAEVITTFADAINYYRRAGISQFLNHKESNMSNRIGQLSYGQSAWQVLKSKEAVCTSMANLNHYFLQGDYDEVGYVSARHNTAGHIFTYILEDGVYYIFDPVDYNKNVSRDWLNTYPTVLKWSEDFQDIADSLVKDFYLPDRINMNSVHLIKSPGDLVMGEGGRYYPVGCEVIQYYGNMNISYVEAGYEWDTQTRIDY